VDKHPNTRGAIEILLEKGRDGALAAADKRERDPARPFLERLGTSGARVLFVFRWEEDELGEAGLAALERAEFVVFVGPWEPAYSGRCDVLLPSTRSAEREGTFTNFAGRVQVIRPVLPRFGMALDPWVLLDGIGRPLGLEIGGDSPAETFDRLAERVPAFRGLRWAELGSTGAWLGGASANGKRAIPAPAGGGPADSGPVAPSGSAKPPAGSAKGRAPGGPASGKISTGPAEAS
jgi:NADH dehydrogenase/NADH:ubiquinone oxidoreductase subunit G